MAPPKQISRVAIFSIGWVLTWLTSGGLTTGFGPLYSRLVDEQQWHDLCPANATDVCSAQEVQLQSVYSTGLLMTVLGQTIFGALLDTIGPRYMTTGAYLFSIAGNVCMAYGDSHNGTDGLLVAGFALIGFGGMGILYASLQLSTLFKDPQLFTSLIVAAYCFSGYNYVFLALNVSRETFFLLYAYVILPTLRRLLLVLFSAIVAVAMVIAFFVFPIHHLVAENTLVPIPGFQLIRPTVDVAKLKSMWAGVKASFKRRDLWAFITIGSMLFLVLVFTGGAVPSIVSSLAHNDASRKNSYTNFLYPLVSNTSFLFAPLAGYLLLTKGFKMTAYVSIALFALLCGAGMLPSLAAQNLTFVLMGITTGFMSTLQYVYIMNCFPHELYGLLSGLVTLLVFIYCLLSYALTSLAQYSFDGNNNYIFLILLGTTLVSAVFVRFLREDSECLDADLRLHFLDHEAAPKTPDDHDI
ncbi:Aste57867_25542 [Aphanomyces stellatus]|uniref:Aste57867_25542 protein n=1 Tax=Aphanomyces stellatus TaxID=120398 RepID=A0A485LTB7_9STRA|nr:hypothetical protein As57867_025463 [Aphanomyces stellatus]VFU02165.1 Aste57867_25542 [Aphanomyces stellatus]